VQREADRILLSRYALVGVVVDEGMTVLQFRGRTAPYLEPAPGTASLEPFCTSKARGTGLGLAICKRIVEAHGGHIEANGNGASGAEIVITLPRRGT